MKEKPSFISILVDAALAFCCALAASLVVPTAYGTPYVLDTLILAAAISAIVFSAAIHLSRKLWIIPGFVFVGWIIFYARLFRGMIAIGAKHLWYSAASLLSLTFSMLPTPEEPMPVEVPAIPVTYFLVLCTFIFALAAVILLAKCRPLLPKLLLPLPPFVLGFIYYDCSPAVFVIALLIIYWAGVIFGRDRRKVAPASSELGRLLFIVLLALIALAIPKVFRESEFEPIPFAERKGIIDAFGEVKERLVTAGKSSPTVYDLREEGERRLDSSKSFAMNCSVSGPVYLRTHSYGRYNGRSWQPAVEYDGEWRSMQALGASQTGNVSVLCIRDAQTSERITPYAFLPDDDPVLSESYIRAKGRTAYVWSYLTGLSTTTGKITAAEEKYYRFALNQYTLPNGDLRNRILSILEDWEMGFSSDPFSSSVIPGKALDLLPELDDYAAATLVAGYVRNTGQYTLSPGKAPEGADFVEYFMKVSQKGYCVHYASATAAILQALGIPARYVVGYRVEVTEPQKWIDVTGESAHAWVEVYIMGVGWMPIESTAGFSPNTGISQKYSGAGNPFETAAPVATYIPSTEMPLPTRTPKPTREPGAAATAAPDEGGQNGGRAAKGAPLLWILSGLAAAIAGWEAFGFLRKKRRQETFGQKDEKAAILAMLRYLERIRKHGAMLPNDPERLANEAAFSHHDMSAEREELLELVRSDCGYIYLYAPIKRFILKYVTFEI